MTFWNSLKSVWINRLVVALEKCKGRRRWVEELILTLSFSYTRFDFLLYWLYLPHGLPLWNKKWQEWWRDSNVVDDDDGDESWWAGNNWKDAWGWRCPIRQPPTLPRCLPTLLHPPAPTLPTISSCELSLSWFVWQTWFWDQTQEKRPLLL